MTAPPPPPSGHLDLDALADVLSGERADDGHLSRCASCAAHLAELSAAQASVVDALAALADPALPEGLELRLTAALDAAAGPARTGTGPAGTGSATGSGSEGGGEASGEGHRDARGSRSEVAPLPRRVRPAWLPAAAASLVLVLGGGLGYALMSGSGLEAGGAATSAAGGAAESDRSSEKSSDSALSVPAEPESGASASSRSGSAVPGPAQQAPSEPGPAGTTSAAAPPRSATGADYADEAQREAVLPRVLAGPDPDEVPTELLSDGPLARLRSPQALDACLSAVTGGSGVAPLALDEAVFRGDPALAVVLPSVDIGEVVVHVVGADCAPGDPDELLVLPASRR